MSQSSTSSIRIVKYARSEGHEAEDTLAVEEPLEIRLLYGPKDQRVQKSISITMRTPGNDAELAIGFLFTEGIISSHDMVEDSFSFSCNEAKENTITIALREDVTIDFQKLERHFYTSSSCGVCGKSSIEAIRTVKPQSVTDEKELFIHAEKLLKLPILLRKQQDVFQSTGGLHASAIFNMNLELLTIREDVGRHNALDKLIGHLLMNNLYPLNKRILLLSGRASFELIQKAAVAGIKIVAAIGAPSSLAVQLAEEFNITLIGFLREDRFNIYCGWQRVIS